MSNSQLMIPTKIKIGYQNRNDTFTKKLAYVIYYDEKGTLRKEKSWESWRDKKIDPDEYDNTPMEGFVLNKKVGGYKSDWNFRNAYVRIYDPRGFEFEISVENLLFILANCDCSRGKGLEGKFVYSWHGTDLVLLPEGCEEYKNSVGFTSLKSMKVLAKELILGATYESKSQDKLIYLGRHKCSEYAHAFKYNYNNNGRVIKGHYVFRLGDRFVLLKDLKSIARVVNTECAGNYADLVEEFMGSKHVDKVKSIDIVESKDESRLIAFEYNGLIYYSPCREDSFYKLKLEDGILICHYEYDNKVPKNIIKSGYNKTVKINFSKKSYDFTTYSF